MMESLFFGGFDPLREVTEVCTVCAGRPPVFRYDYRGLNEKGESEKTTGFCCVACAKELLERLESAESKEWAKEEAALESDALDVREFRKRRLAVFPGSKAR
jgi:hypothetical protein